MSEHKKVTEVYAIDEDELLELRTESAYWEASYSFYMEVKNRSVESLSDKQIEWLDRIDNYLDDIKIDWGDCPNMF